MNDEVLVKVEGVSKKFCKDLKTSLWYGVKDLGSEFLGKQSKGEKELREKEFWAVKDVSFEVRRGECLGLIGHNGAGKSTLLKILNGLIKPDKGKITMRGRIGALIELGAGFNPILTGRENVYINGQVLGFTKKEIDQKLGAIVDFAEIEDFIDTPVRNYSSGMKVRLGFAIAAQMEPDVLIIDEVLAVGDIGFRIKCFNIINKLLENTAVIIVSHSMPQIAKATNRLILLDKGKMQISTKDIKEGIELYYKKFESTDNKLVIENGFKLSDLKLYTNENWGNKIPSDGDIKYLDDLYFNFSFISDFKIDLFGIIIRFYDMSLNSIATAQANVIPFNEVMTLQIPNIQFSTGSYFVDFYFMEYFRNEKSEAILAHYKNFLTLDISGSEIKNHSSFQLQTKLI